jgi:hypothetical protein
MHFAGRPLEAALEATTGWRFVAEELRAVGARSLNLSGRVDRGMGSGSASSGARR